MNPNFQGEFVERTAFLDEIKLQLSVHPICAILGARQVGKTTLAHQFAEQQSIPVEFFDLENPTHLRTFRNSYAYAEQVQRLHCSYC